MTNGRAAVRFTEEMKGHVAFGESDHRRGERDGRAGGTRLMFHLTIEVEDMESFSADPAHEAAVSGWVDCHELGGRLPVQGGSFNLFVDGPPGEKRMLYRLHFRDGVGHPLTLSGHKVMRPASPLRLWPDTTTLYTMVLRGTLGPAEESGAEVVASGILHIRPQAFARQLTTFRSAAPTGGEGVRALARFGRLFTGQLWRLYGRRSAI